MGIFVTIALLTTFGALLYWINKEESTVKQQRVSSSKPSTLSDLMKELQSQVGKDKQGWILNIIIVITFICVLQFGLHFMWPDWHAKHWHDGWLVFTEIAAGIGFAMRVRDPDAKPMRHIVGTVILMIVLLVAVRNTFFPPTSDSEKPDSSINAQAAVRTTSSTLAPRLAPSISMGTPACFKEELGPEKDLAYLRFPGQMDVLAVLCRESRFNHFDPKDRTKVFTNENRDPLTDIVTSTDVGIAQINSVHDAELKKLDLDKNKVEDNLAYAKILYEKQGLLDWTPRLANNKTLVFEVNVEPGEVGSNTFKLPIRDLKECLWVPSRPALLIVTGADGTVHQFEFYPLSEKNKFLDLDPVVKPVKEYKFKSKDDQSVLVTVTYQY